MGLLGSISAGPGRISNQQYEAKDGSGKRYRTEIIAQRVQFLGGRAGADAGGGMDEPMDIGSVGRCSRPDGRRRHPFLATALVATERRGAQETRL